MANQVKRDYVDVNAADFSAQVQTMLEHDRKLYQQQKELRLAIAKAMTAETTLPQGKVITGIAFTRWGQLQVAIGDAEPTRVSNAKPRKTLADYVAACESNGVAH